MGNQTGKVSVKGTKFIDDIDSKTSKTNWIAGVASPPGRPVIELSTRLTAPEEDSVTDEINLSWASPEDDGGYPITGYRVEMLDIQSGRWVEVTFIDGYEPKCTLSNILYGIMYRFRVVCLNDAGPSQPGEPSEPIVIDVPGVQIAPYFVQMLNDTIALEHEKVTFQVRVLGTPKPSIQWYKDDVEIFACDRIEMREEDEGGAVILKEARLSDSGTIKCVASNLLGRCTSTALFSIEAAPRFELPENYTDGLIFRHDEVIRLRVPMIAKPAPKVVWFFEDEPISAGTDLTIETTDSFTKLNIQGAKRWHCGEFRVYAENEYGEDACSILVTVTSPPSPPGRPVVIDISETKCTLRWEPSEDDGGADVKHYIVEYFRDVWEVWLKAKTTKETQVTIDDLIPGSRYKFRIKSENSYGISEPGEESDPFDVGGVSSDRNEDASSWVSVSSPTPDINIEITPETPTAPKRKATNRESHMAKAKEMWGSDEQEDDILDRFLKAKRFQQNQMPSYESDGIPSMVGIEEYQSESEAEIGDHRSTRNVRRLYAELQQFSSDHPDLESVSEDEMISSKSDLRRARELYEELRQMSVETGGSIEDLVQGAISTSNESVSSIIPLEKRQELSRFELSLKQMIEEAKQMAKTPSGSQEELYRRSPSVAESVVSVIERQRPVTSSLGGTYLQPPIISVTPEMRESPPRISPQQPIRPPRTPSPRRNSSFQDIPPAPPSPKIEAPPSPSRYHQQQKLMHDPNEFTSERSERTAGHSPRISRADMNSMASSPQPPSLPKRRPEPEKPKPEVPLVGADRYEEIITSSRRSSSRGPRSIQGSMTNLFQPGSTMAMREETKQMSMSQTSMSPMSMSRSNLMQDNLGSMSKLNQNLPERPGSWATGNLNNKLMGEMSSSDLNLNGNHSPALNMSSSAMNLNGNHSSAFNMNGSHQNLNINGNMNVSNGNINAKIQSSQPSTMIKRPLTQSQQKLQQQPQSSQQQQQTDRKGFVPKTIEPSIDPLRPENRPNYVNVQSSYPDWLMMTSAYAMVFVTILLLSNITPNGKLFIHFTAFWSMVLYFSIDKTDDQTTDVLDTVMENFVKVPK